MLTVTMDLPFACNIAVVGETAHVGWKAALLEVIVQESATLPAKLFVPAMVTGTLFPVVAPDIKLIEEEFAVSEIAGGMLATMTVAGELVDAK